MEGEDLGLFQTNISFACGYWLQLPVSEVWGEPATWSTVELGIVRATVIKGNKLIHLIFSKRMFVAIYMDICK
jgi:hypothetical protein